MQIGQHPQINSQPTQQTKSGIVVTSKLIASINILHLPSQELKEEIVKQCYDNPALEIDDIPQCLACGAPLRDGVCTQCGPRGQMPTNGEVATTIPDYGEGFEHTAYMNDDEDYDPLARVSTTISLEDHLLSAMRPSLSDEDLHIAEALVGSLDDHGYLAIAVEDIADALPATVERVEDVLEILQSQEPLGIGARDLRECLLIQLRWFRDQGHPQPLAEKIVDGFLREVADRRFVDIGRELGTTSTHVRRAWDFIKANLNPYPAHAALEGVVLRGGSGRGSTALVRPDVIIRRTDQGFEAEVVESKRFQMRINATYHAIAQSNVAMTDGDRQHIRKYVQQAQFFIDCVQQRWATLKKIANALIDVQYDFLDKGVRYLRPLTRSELATYVDLHEATISRATNDKYVLLPDGRTISFDDFFNASLRAKDTLRELIAAENPHKPLSDEDLAEQLTLRGMPVARRTVAKYREAMKILPSRLR